MALAKEEKSSCVKSAQLHKSDTGSVEVQVTILTADIKKLTEHFNTHKGDNHSRRGLLAKVSARRKLLKYLERTDVNRYKELIKALGLRH